jgi:hypothetical protein
MSCNSSVISGLSGSTMGMGELLDENTFDDFIDDIEQNESVAHLLDGLSSGDFEDFVDGENVDPTVTSAHGEAHSISIVSSVDVGQSVQNPSVVVEGQSINTSCSSVGKAAAVVATPSHGDIFSSLLSGCHSFLGQVREACAQQLKGLSELCSDLEKVKIDLDSMLAKEKSKAGQIYLNVLSEECVKLLAYISIDRMAFESGSWLC